MAELLPGMDVAPNVHPLFVHVPVALWALAFGFWAFATLRTRNDVFSAGRWTLYLGTAGAFAAIATGLLAAGQLGHDAPGHEYVHVHRNFMFAATAAAVVTCVGAFLWRGRSDRRRRVALLVALGVVNVLSALGADRGVVLVYG